MGVEIPNPYLLVSILALVFSGIALITRALEKNLSVREFEAYSNAVARDIHRVENRLLHLEQTRPTTGELEILADGLNKRLDSIIAVKGG